MLVGWWIRGAIVSALMLTAAAPLQAQEKKDRKGDSSGGYSAIIDNIDMLVENYAKFLGRKYDLNDEQFGFTKQMIRDRVYGFLDKNETEVRDLFDQMFQARTAGNMSQTGLIDWGKRVAPIYEEAKKIIEGANSEWRDVLNDQQRAIHDEDLKLMKQSFEETDEKLGRIQQGEMTIDEFVKPSGGRPSRRKATPPPPQVVENSDPAQTGESPKQINSNGYIKRAPAPGSEKKDVAGVDANPPMSPVPADGQQPGQDPSQQGQIVEPAGEAVAEQPAAQPEHVDQPAAPAVQPERSANRGGKQAQPKGAGKNFESEWEKYVRDFIQKYQLNDDQTQRANAFLADCEAQAERLIANKKGELERIEKRENELKTAPAAPTAAGVAKNAPAADGKAKESAELAKRRDELLAPVNRIFEDQLKPKLEKLPTRAQRKAAEEAAAKKGPAKSDKAPSKDGKPGADVKPGAAKDTEKKP